MKAITYLIILTIVTTLVASVPITTSSSVEYYVSSTNGNDNNSGDFNHPFKTIQKGISVVQGGDTVYVRGGIYNELVTFVRSGTPGNPITLSGYRNEKAIVDGTGFTIAHRQGLIDDQWHSYINIINMNVQYSDECGISVRDGPCGHIRIEGCSTYDTDQSGICSYGGDTLPYTELHNITIKNNRVGKSVMDMGGQEAITVRFTKNFEVCYNYIYHMGNIGIDAKNGSSYGIIHHNEINQSGDDAPWVSNAIYVDSGCKRLNRICHDIDVYSNLIHGHCNGLKIGSESGGRVENVSFYNNVVYNARVGFRDDNNGLGDGYTYIKNNVIVVNNNFINCNWSVFITEPGENIKNFTLRNNIMSAINNIFQWNYPPSLEEVHNDHNLYFTDPGASFRGTDYVIGSPTFVDEMNHNYHLTSDSLGVDVGSSLSPSTDFDGVIRPQGLGVDIGAYEYQKSDNGNNPPNKPTITGPTSSIKGTSYTYSTNTTDPDGDKIKYGWDWNGDGTTDEWTSLYTSGATASTSHIFTSIGTYNIKVIAEDEHGAQSTVSSELLVTITSNPPNKPNKPSGSSSGKPGVSYTYQTSTTDSDGDQVYYMWDWADGTPLTWMEPYNSEQTATALHIWSAKGIYSVKVKAKDSTGAESVWSDPLPITMPCSYNKLILQFLELLFERFPYAFPILRQLLGY